jgi:hypothetical protein
MRTRRAPRKLSPTQREVLVKLADGWELATRTSDRYACLAKHGVENGGQFARVNMATLRLLFSRGYLLHVGGLAQKIYTISDKGHKALGPGSMMMEVTEAESSDVLDNITEAFEL